MEVEDARSAMLSNLEVLQLLKEVKNDSKLKERGKEKSFGLNTVVYQSLKYLDEMPCKNQSADSIANFVSQLKANDIKLTKAEMLQVINLRPTSAVELQLLIEESVDRISEDKEQLLLEIIAECFPVDETGSSK